MDKKIITLFRWLAETCWEGGDIEGCELQEKLTEAGVLVPTLVSKPCSPTCNCADYSEFPTECFRLAPQYRKAA